MTKRERENEIMRRLMLERRSWHLAAHSHHIHNCAGPYKSEKNVRIHVIVAAAKSNTFVHWRDDEDLVRCCSARRLFLCRLWVCVFCFFLLTLPTSNWVFFSIIMHNIGIGIRQPICKSKPFDKLGEFTFSAHALESRVVNSVADAFVPENQKSFCHPRHARNVLYLLWMRPNFLFFPL